MSASIPLRTYLVGNATHRRSMRSWKNAPEHRRVRAPAPRRADDDELLAMPGADEAHTGELLTYVHID